MYPNKITVIWNSKRLLFVIFVQYSYNYLDIVLFLPHVPLLSYIYAISLKQS